MRLAGWQKSPGGVAATLLGAALLSVAAVLGMGLRLLEQDLALERQQERERLEATMDAAVAQTGRALAQTAQAMMTETWQPAGGDAVLARAKKGQLTVLPPESLPFLPETVSSPAPDAAIFAAYEQEEFVRNDWEKAAAGYRRLADSGDVQTRTAALVRLARVQAKAGQTGAARETYRKLARLEDGNFDGVPAPLVAMLALGAGAELGERLDHPRQAVSRDVFLFHAGRAEALSGGRWRRKAERVALAEAIHGAWPEGEGSGRSVADGLTLLWARVGDHAAVMAAGKEYARREWLHESLETGGTGTGTRAASATGLPWDVRPRDRGNGPPTVFSGRRRLLAMAMLTVQTLILLAGYLSWRAVSREMAAGRMQTDFVAAVSHEFRTPLTALRQFTGMLLERESLTDAQRRTCYEAQARSTERLSRLVESLLDFRRMEAGARPYTMEPLDGAELVRRVAGEFAREAGDPVAVTAPERCPLRADAGALTLALWNLLDNALKYGGSGAVALETRAGEVRIRVKDNGPGIPAGERRRIFERFVRGEQARRMGVKGTGIGLAMVRHVVEAHRGRVELESEPGAGSTFTMVLPAGD